MTYAHLLQYSLWLTTYGASDGFDFLCASAYLGLEAASYSINSKSRRRCDSGFRYCTMHRLLASGRANHYFYSLAGDIEVAHRANDTVAMYGPILLHYAPSGGRLHLLVLLCRISGAALGRL